MKSDKKPQKTNRSFRGLHTVAYARVDGLVLLRPSRQVHNRRSIEPYDFRTLEYEHKGRTTLRPELYMKL